MCNAVKRAGISTTAQTISSRISTTVSLSEQGEKWYGRSGFRRRALALMSTPEIIRAIASKREEAASKRREAELLEAEVRGMEAILALIPQTPIRAGGTSVSVLRSTGPNSEAISRIGEARSLGRQPGAIANRWKRHLLELRQLDEPFSSSDVINIVAERENRTMRPSEVRRQFERFIEHGHVKVVGNDRYIVPNDAAVRFRAALSNALDDDDINDDNENDDHGKEAISNSSIMDKSLVDADNISNSAPVNADGGDDDDGESLL